MEKVQDYVDTVNAPWGKMFYDMLFAQLALPQTPKLNILDFGSGLGVTANYYAAWHNVTAVEPNNEMIENSFCGNSYTQIWGGIEHINNIADDTFDIVFCHNVLEYIKDKEPILQALLRVLKSHGKLSIVKHNRVGRVLHTAVFRNDPQRAMSILDEGSNDANKYLGTQYLYSNYELRCWIAKHGGSMINEYGMRAFWALGQDNAVKYSSEWYDKMLELEMKVSKMDEYVKFAFLHHLIFQKQ